MQTYNNYGSWLQKKYEGKKVYKVVADAMLSCPNRDGIKGYGGCSYCNIDAFTPEPARLNRHMGTQIKHSMNRYKKMYGANLFIIYFQPGTNTYAPVSYLKALYDEALSYNKEETAGLAIGTRADCMEEEKIRLLESYAETTDVYLEMGMESIYEDTLVKINRMCTHADLVAVLERLKYSKINICLHCIFGLPDETEEMMLKYADEINRFPQIKFIKLHHLYIAKGSVMGVRHKKTPFKLFTLKEYTNFLCAFLPRLRRDIVIQRLFAVSDPELLIAPNWNLKKQAIQSHLESEFRKRGIIQGMNLE